MKGITIKNLGGGGLYQPIMILLPKTFKPRNEKTGFKTEASTKYCQMKSLKPKYFFRHRRGRVLKQIARLSGDSRKR